MKYFFFNIDSEIDRLEIVVNVSSIALFHESVINSKKGVSQIKCES
jgi:hypothetical protein